MKIDNEAEIIKLVEKTTKAYLKYKEASAKVSELIDPLLKKAKTQEDINYLLQITSPVMKGKYTSADYIGRMWIYYKSEDLKAKAKKKAKK